MAVKKKKTTKKKPAKKRASVGAITKYTRTIYGSTKVRAAKKKKADAEKAYATAVKLEKAKYKRLKK